MGTYIAFGFGAILGACVGFIIAGLLFINGGKD